MGGCVADRGRRTAFGGGGRGVAKAARLQCRGSPKFSRWNLRGQSVPGRSGGDAWRQQVALNRKLTRRRGLQRSRLRDPEARAPRGAGASARPLRPQLTVRSRREAGESLESFPLAACSPPPGVPRGRPRLPVPGGLERVASRWGPGRRSAASAAQYAPYAQLQGALPSSPAPRRAQRSVVAGPGAGSQKLTRKPFRWGLKGYDVGLLSLSLSWVLMASLPTWQNRHEFASH